MKEFSTLGRLLIAAIAVFGLALVLGGAGYVVSETLRPPPVKPVLFTDLSGTWEIVGADHDASTSAPSSITLPNASHDFLPMPWVQWVSYRRTFDTPTACAQVDCSLLIGEFFSAAAICLNGAEVAQDALLPPAKPKGRNFYLLAPVGKLLAPPGERNTLEIKVLGNASAGRSPDRWASSKAPSARAFKPFIGSR